MGDEMAVTKAVNHLFGGDALHVARHASHFFRFTPCAFPL